MGIGSLQPGTPTDSDSAGAGNEKMQEIQAELQASFPGFTPGDDVVTATATQIQEAVENTVTSVQTFNGREGPDVTIINDDVKIAQIDDSDAPAQVTRNTRVFMTNAEKNKLATVASGANNIQQLGQINDVEVGTKTAGQFLAFGGTNWFNFTAWQPIWERAHYYNPVGDPDASGTNYTVGFANQTGEVDGTVVQIQRTPFFQVTAVINAIVVVMPSIDGGTDNEGGRIGDMVMTRATGGVARNVSATSIRADNSLRDNVIERAIEDNNASPNPDRYYLRGGFAGVLNAGDSIRIHGDRQGGQVDGNRVGSVSVVALPIGNVNSFS